MTKIRNIVFLLVILTVSLTFARTWTATSGHKVEGDFVKLEGEVVHIGLANGKTAKIKLQQLSEADREFAKKQAEKKADSPFEIDDAPAKPKMTETGGKKTTNITVEGIGSTFEAAKKDAFRNAISEVVGTIVDAETRVAQEKVLEQILTASNAYVEHHKIVSQKQEGGLWHVTMDATVESRALQLRLGEAPVTTSKVDGTNLLDRHENKVEAEAAPILLLAKTLRDQNFPYSIMEATAEMVKEPVKKDGNNFVMQFNVTVKANPQKFDEFRKVIEPVLEKVAISKRTSTLKSEKRNPSDRLAYIVDPPKSKLRKAADPIFVHINTTRNNAVTRTGWNTYELPNKAVALFAAYTAVIPASEITLHAEDGSSFASERLCCYHVLPNYYANIYSFNCMNQMEGFPYRENKISANTGSLCPLEAINASHIPLEFQLNFQHFHLGPFFTVGISFLPGARLTTTMTLEPDELKAVKSIKCSIVSQNPEMDAYYRKLPEILKNWQPKFPRY